MTSRGDQRRSTEASSLAQLAGAIKGTDECAGSLLFKARRGELRAADLQAFEEHLKVCASCRFFRQMALDFDEAGSAQPEDGMLVGRMMAHAERHLQGASAVRHTRPGRPGVASGWKRASALVAALLLLAGVASGAWWYTGVQSRKDIGPAAQAIASKPVRAHQRSLSASLPSVDSVASNEPAPPPAAQERGQLVERLGPASVVSAPSKHDPATLISSKAVQPKASSSRLSPEQRPERSADALFREANTARREGRSGDAVALYETLQHEFPRSPEAQMSHLLLGRMLLASGKASRAVEQFNRALGSPAAAPVYPEALYGKGQALAAIGAKGDEVATWRELLVKFPASPYARHARDRMTQLK